MKETFISIFKLEFLDDMSGECIFVGRPSDLIDKYYSQTKNER